MSVIRGIAFLFVCIYAISRFFSSRPPFLLSFFVGSQGYRLLVVRGGISGSAADPNYPSGDSVTHCFLSFQSLWVLCFKSLVYLSFNGLPSGEALTTGISGSSSPATGTSLAT
nr:hypothetical protein [Glycine max]